LFRPDLRRRNLSRRDGLIAIYASLAIVRWPQCASHECGEWSARGESAKKHRIVPAAADWGGHLCVHFELPHAMGASSACFFAHSTAFRLGRYTMSP